MCVCAPFSVPSDLATSHGSVQADRGGTSEDEARRDEVPGARRRLPDTGRKRYVLIINVN